MAFPIPRRAGTTRHLGTGSGGNRALGARLQIIGTKDSEIDHEIADHRFASWRQARLCLSPTAVLGNSRNTGHTQRLNMTSPDTLTLPKVPPPGSGAREFGGNVGAGHLWFFPDECNRIYRYLPFKATATERSS